MEDLRDPRTRFPDVNDIWEARFLVLTEDTLERIDAAGNCNRQLYKAREWVDRHTQLEKTYDERRRSSD
jgi:hypothetical protein